MLSLVAGFKNARIMFMPCCFYDRIFKVAGGSFCKNHDVDFDVAWAIMSASTYKEENKKW